MFHHKGSDVRQAVAFLDVASDNIRRTIANPIDPELPADFRRVLEAVHQRIKVLDGEIAQRKEELGIALPLSTAAIVNVDEHALFALVSHVGRVIGDCWRRIEDSEAAVLQQIEPDRQGTRRPMAKHSSIGCRRTRNSGRR